ncbi:MAG: NAD-dependent epimerase/dehydratase family protein [Planctomycetaceae bacterium]
MSGPLPGRVASVEELEELLSRPNDPVCRALAGLTGDLLLLGVGGKMGLSLARMARRAWQRVGHPGRVIGVSRFGAGGDAAFHRHGIETIRCDLLDPHQRQNLPQTANVVVMLGRKFGSTGDEPLTWAMNALLAAELCRQFPNSRLVAFSTGNVYGLVPITSGGAREEDAPQPVGEYAQSCLGRERFYQYCCQSLGIPAALIRLNYACDLRYGVLVDLALRVWNREPIDLAMGYFNTIWQGDANAQTLCAFEHLTTPPWLVNVTGDTILSVREVCLGLAQRWGIPVEFAGSESETALLSNNSRARALWGSPQVSTEQLLDWVADWIEHNRPLLGKPTHFESRAGQF